MDENSPLTSSATAGPRGVIAGWPPAPCPRAPDLPSPTPPTPPNKPETPPPTRPRGLHEGSGATLPPCHQPLAPRPLPPISSHHIVSPRHSRRASMKVLKVLKVRLWRAPIAYAYRVPRGLNPPRETKQSTIVPAPHKQSTPKPISLIDRSPPPPMSSRGPARDLGLGGSPPPPPPPGPPPEPESPPPRRQSILSSPPPPPHPPPYPHLHTHSFPLVPLDLQCYPFPRRFRAHIYPTSPTRAPTPRAPGLHNCSTFRSTNSSLHRPRRPLVLEGADYP